MIYADITVKCGNGITISSAEKIAELASRLESAIWIEYHDTRANAKSMLSVISLGVGRGQTVRVSAHGKDENEALAAVKELLEK